MIIRIIEEAANRLRTARQLKTYQGYIDGYIGDYLHGWIRKKNDETPLFVDIFLNGDLVHRRVLANNFRADLKEEKIGAGTFGFRVPIDNLYLASNCRVTVCLSGQKRTLLSRRIPVTPEIAAQRGLAPAKSHLDSAEIGNSRGASFLASKFITRVNTPTPRYNFHFESLEESLFCGWAVDTNNPGAVFTMGLSFNGSWFCDVRNDASRDDLYRLKISGGRGGIKQLLPRGLIKSGKTTVALRLPSGEEFKKEFVVTCTDSPPPAAPSRRLNSSRNRTGASVTKRPTLSEKL
ncbi:hypothetical protein AADZ90_017655 [Aestuariibius sp. 2305UL40-4]|uniref:hypothetical protein n=1 Tax=Aestuariibius violaceus TaxID=3234132 RepID=UPI00347E1A7E